MQLGFFVEMINKELANQIRKSQNLRLRHLAERTGLSVSYMGQIFGGRLAMIPRPTQKKIARALGVKESLIFNDHTRTDKNEPKPLP